MEYINKSKYISTSKCFSLCKSVCQDSNCSLVFLLFAYVLLEILKLQKMKSDLEQNYRTADH